MRPQAQRPYIPRRSLRPRPAPTLSAAVHRGLHGARAQQQGVSLMELLLVAGVIAAGTAIVFNVYQNVNAASKVDAEGESLRALTKNVLDSYIASADYSSLTTERAIEDGLFPTTMMSDGTGEPTSTWGKPVRVVATDINRDGANLENWGFVIAYDDVPAKACVDLISQAGPEFNDIRVEGTSIGVGANLNVTQMGQLCNRATGADVQFVFERRALQNEGGALTLCSDSLPTDAETQVMSCPAGQYGLVNQSRSAFCVSSYGSFQWTPWATTSQTCSPCPTPESQALVCPSGQVGTISQTRTYNCSGQGSWGPWTTTSNTCTACPSPEGRTLDCPSGQYGAIQQSRSFTCSGQGSWGTWTTTSNTCTACPAPTTQTSKQWVASSANCPSGQYGSNTWEREQSQSRSVTYTCPAGTAALPSPVYGTWSAWTDTGVTRNVVNTCGACPAPATEIQGRWVDSSATCPSGQVGTNTWERYQTSTRSVTYSCPAGTSTLPPAVYGTWSAWADTGTTRNVVNTCTTCPAPAVETQTLSCPSFQTGSITQQRTRPYNCSGTGSWGSWGAWTTTSNTCALPSCDGSLQSNGNNYMARYPDLANAFYNSWGQNYNQVYAHWYNAGYYEGRQSCWGAPCVLPSPSTQTEYREQSELRQFACPAGQYGPNPGIDEWRTLYQSRSRTASCPSPTTPYTWSAYSAWSTYNTSAWTRTANHCNNCPAPFGQNEYQLVYRSAGCPAGQTGIQQWNAQQVRSRTGSYNCPAGTTSIPGATYTAWSAWSDTGYTQDYSSTCTPSCVAPAPSYQYDYNWNTCGAGKLIEPGERRQLVTWTCPGPTANYGNWETIRMPRCCAGGKTCSIN